MTMIGDYLYKGPSFTLNDGRTVMMQHLNQGLTYAHILEGIPYGEDYQGIVNLHKTWAEQRYKNSKIILLEPRLRELPLPKEQLERLWAKNNKANQLINENLSEEDAFERVMEKSSSQAPVSIGSVACRALFESDPIKDGNWGFVSELIVLWFQDGLPCLSIHM